MRPSSLPMLKQCPCWESNGGSADTESGTNRHAVLSGMLAGNFEPLSSIDLPDEEFEAVEWAADYIRVHAPMSDHPLHCERKMHLTDDAFNEIMSGTPDVSCGPELFDLKWRERDYSAQMAAYSLMMMQEIGWPSVRVHLLFGESKRAVVYEFTEAQALEIVNGIVASVLVADKQPKPCDYCAWCARRLTCPALIKPALEIVKHRENVRPEDLTAFEAWLAAGAHASQLTDAGLMGTVLRIARKIKEFSAAAEHYAKEMAVKQGVVPTGFKIGTKAGKKFVTDATAAFGLAGLPQDEFLKTCAIRLNSSKKYPDQVGLIDMFAKFHGQKKAAAKRDVLSRLDPVIKQGNPSISLTADGEFESEETSEE